MILLVIPANILLFMDIQLFWHISTIAIAVTAWDAHQSLRRYVPQEVRALMGEHLDASHLNMRINILVLFGILASLSLTAYGSYCSFYKWDDRNHSIISALSFLTFTTPFMLMFAIFVPSIYLICTLLGSDIGQLATLVQGSEGEEFGLNVGSLLWTYTESNEKLRKFSTTFQRSIALYIISLIYFVLEVPSDRIFLVASVNISLIAVKLAILAIPSNTSGVLRSSIEMLRPRESQFVNYLLLKSEIQRGIGGVTLYDQEINQQNVVSFLMRLFVVVLIVKGGMKESVFAFFL